MTKEKTLDFIIQCIDTTIASDQVHELKGNLDPDYKFVVGIAISDLGASEKSILEQIKLKGIDLLPQDFEAVHVMATSAVAPNKRFFSWFTPVETHGDELVIRFSDPEYTSDYTLQVQILLTNNPDKLQHVLFA